MLVDADDFGPNGGPRVAPAPVALVRPEPFLFARRAQRLTRLAQDHALGGYLRFIASLAQRQAAAVPPPYPDWRDALAALLAGEDDPSWTDAAREAAAGLRQASADNLSARGERWLAATPKSDELSDAPFLAAALQLSRTQAALTAAPKEHADPSCCPLCGGHPVAAALESRDGVEGNRYLHCGLCGTAWRRERLVCGVCGVEGSIKHRKLDGYPVDVKAECCDACGGYVKLFDSQTTPKLEPLADDLASLALDLLLAQEDWGRPWPNPFLIGA